MIITEALNQPIQMISVCDIDGEIRPLRFRFEDQTHHIITVTIQEVMVVKEINYVGIQSYLYICKAVIGSMLQLFELRYTIKSHRWVLFRMIT